MIGIYHLSTVFLTLLDCSYVQLSTKQNSHLLLWTIFKAQMIDGQVSSLCYMRPTLQKGLVYLSYVLGTTNLDEKGQTLLSHSHLIHKQT
jgi:hypothetical protein